MLDNDVCDQLHDAIAQLLPAGTAFVLVLGNPEWDGPAEGLSNVQLELRDALLRSVLNAPGVDTSGTC